MTITAGSPSGGALPTLAHEEPELFAQLVIDPYLED